MVAWLSAKYYFSVKEFTKLSIRAVTLNYTRTAVQSLANEALEYSRKNAAIDPLLEKFEIKPKATNGTTPAPATPPAPK